MQATIHIFADALSIYFYYQQAWSSCCVVGAELKNASVTKNFTILVTTHHVASCEISCEVFCGTFSAMGSIAPIDISKRYGFGLGIWKFGLNFLNYQLLLKKNKNMFLSKVFVI